MVNSDGNSNVHAATLELQSAVTIDVNRPPVSLRLPPTIDYSSPPPPYSAIDVPRASPSPTIVQPVLTKRPDVVRCPHCHDQVTTRIIYKNTDRTHIAAGFICGFTVWCMLCCLSVLPYYLTTLKTAQHFCPNCNSLIGEN